MKFLILRFYVRVTVGLVALFCALIVAMSVIGQAMRGDMLVFASTDAPARPYLFDLARHLLTPLRPLDYEGGGFYFSPDGNWLLYTDYSAEGNSLRAFNMLNGTENVLVEWDTGGITSLSWSPDSNYIAYMLPEEGVLRIIDRDGGDSRIVVPWRVGALAWSPNGKAIAFVTGGSDIWVTNTDGTNQHLIYSSELYIQILLRWSPDGRFLAFVSLYPDLSKVHNVLYVVNSITGQVTTLTRYSTMYFGGLIWSPDSRYLGFSASTDNSDGVFITDIQTGFIEQLVTSSDTLFLTGWSSDGHSLLVAATPQGSAYQTYVLARDGSTFYCATCGYGLETVFSTQWLP